MEDQLSKRERQIMDIVYKNGRVSAQQVLEQMHDAPSYSAVRTFLSILERKGQLDHVKEGSRYIFFPRKEKKVARSSALKRVMNTFFNNSVTETVSAILGDSEQISDEEYQVLQDMIKKAYKKEA